MPRGASTVPLPTHLVNGDEIVDITQQYPMFVMPIDKVLQLDRIPTHEEAFDKLVTWDPTMGNAMFVSHTWISFEHPDNADNVKLRTLQGLLKLLVAGKLKVPPNVFKALLAGVKEISAKKMAKVKKIGKAVKETENRIPFVMFQKAEKHDKARRSVIFNCKKYNPFGGMIEATVKNRYISSYFVPDGGKAKNCECFHYLRFNHGCYSVVYG